MLKTNMQDKVIVVAGATGGIGTGIAKKLDEAGATTVLMGRNSAKLNELCRQLQGTSYQYKVDFEDVEMVGEVFSFLKEKGLKADGLVYAVGVCADVPIRAGDLSEMQKNMQVNYYAYVELCKKFANRRNSNEGSSIVALSSIASLMCEKAMSQYSASKAALNAVTQTMSKEFAGRKIRVNALAPAFVDTKMAWGTSISMDDFENYLAEHQPYGIIPVKEIAAWTEFLLSDITAHITGEIIRISGGMY